MDRAAKPAEASPAGIKPSRLRRTSFILPYSSDNNTGDERNPEDSLVSRGKMGQARVVRRNVSSYLSTVPFKVRVLRVLRFQIALTYYAAKGFPE